MSYKHSLAAVLLALANAPASAAAWDQKHFNPAPDADDVVMPMPCEGAMVFRKVVVPLAGPLQDYPIQVGQDHTGWGYVEQVRPAYVAGSFTDTAGKSSRFYLMAKYELTQLQYMAIMDGECPKPSNKLRLPQTSVSWFDAMQAANRYNLWLRKNKADAIPMEDGVPGFLRLPTEVEWEFAARGGLAVGSAEFRDAVYPMPEGMTAHEWFSGAQSSNGKLQLAGLLKANPLGLHDMLGNAAEMIFEPFRLNKIDRQHGQAGGYVVRGASYLVPQADLRSSARKEEPYYRDDGETRSNSTGFRLALVSTALTSRDRIASIEKSWEGLGSKEQKDPTKGQEKAAVQQLGDLASAVEDKKLQEQLKTLERELRASNQRQEEARDQAIRASLNLGAFLCTKLKDDGQYLGALNRNYKINCQDAEESDAKVCASRKALLDQQHDRVSKLASYYANGMVETSTLYGKTLLGDQVPVMKETFARSTQLKGLKDYLDVYWNHQQAYLSTGKIDTTTWLADCQAVANQ